MLPEWFGDLGNSAYSLFQIMTLESWSMGIVRPVMEVYPYAWAFFVPFIMMTTFAVVNLLVGLIVNSMQGFAPEGHKQFEGDGKTPEGEYIIDRRNPNSRFHLSIGISYPNAADRAFARSQGKSPGGDIFIHGRGKYPGSNRDDWTWGCIAVTDREMEDIYAMVRNGTPITIKP
jgi:hypothetical protein